MTPTTKRSLAFRLRPLLVALLAPLVVTGALLVVLACSPPVLFSYIEPGEPTKEPRWSVLNPLRSRAPERPAEELLRELRDGRAATVLPPFVEDHKMGSAALVDRELECRLVSWHLVRRKDSSNRADLLYHAARADAVDDTSRPVRIRVERTAPGGAWQVVSFSAVY